MWSHFFYEKENSREYIGDERPGERENVCPPVWKRKLWFYQLTNKWNLPWMEIWGVCWRLCTKNSTNGEICSFELMLDVLAMFSSTNANNLIEVLLVLAKKYFNDFSRHLFIDFFCLKFIHSEKCVKREENFILLSFRNWSWTPWIFVLRKRKTSIVKSFYFHSIQNTISSWFALPMVMYVQLNYSISSTTTHHFTLGHRISSIHTESLGTRYSKST